MSVCISHWYRKAMFSVIALSFVLFRFVYFGLLILTGGGGGFSIRSSDLGGGVGGLGLGHFG